MIMDRFIHYYGNSLYSEDNNIQLDKLQLDCERVPVRSND